jgi:hypothetical protein
VGAVVGVLRAGIPEYIQSAKVAAQTNAVIESTGGVANVTAAHVRDLGAALMEKSGVDDEAIKTGENMILTFRGIRNEAGAGNDIFDQTSQAVLDMDTAMTHGNVTAESMAKTSILVGKALQDPIKGVTALRRVGVQLSAAQTKQIAGFIKSGDTMKAQKVILGELTKEFGGSAKAIGDTLPGQINKLKETFKNFAGDLVGDFVPAFTSALGVMSKGLQGLESFVARIKDAKGFRAKIEVVLGTVKGIAERAGEVARDIASALKTKLEGVNWASTGTKIGQAISNALTFTTEKLGVLLTAILAWVTSHARQFGEVGALIGVYVLTTLTDPAFWARHWQLALSIAVLSLGKGLGRFAPEIARLGTQLGEKLAASLGAAAPKFVLAAIAVIEAFAKTYAKLGGKLVVISALAVATAIRAVLAGVPKAVSAGAELAAGIVRGVGSGIQGVVSAVVAAFQGVWAWIHGARGSAYAYAFSIGSGIVEGIIAGIAGLATRVANAISGAVKGAISGAKGALGIHSPSVLTMLEIGKPLGEGVILGFLLGLNDLPEKVGAKTKAQLETLKTRFESQKSIFADAFSRLMDYALKAFDAKTTSLLAAIGSNFDHLRDVLHKKFDGLREAAQKGLDVASAKIELTLSVKLQGIDDWAAQLTPAEKALKQLEDAHAATARAISISDAQAGLEAAVAGGDPKAVLDAQKALDDALYAEKIYQLGVTAAAERKARDEEAAERKQAAQDAADAAKQVRQEDYDDRIAQLQATEDASIASLDRQQAAEEIQLQARRDLQRQHLEDALAALETLAEASPKALKKVQGKIAKLFAQFGISAKDAGKDLGTAFAQGMEEAFDKVEKTARALAALVAKYLPHSPAKAGPLSKLPDWQAYLLDGLQENIAAANAALSDLKPPTVDQQQVGLKLNVELTGLQELKDAVAGVAPELGVELRQQLSLAEADFKNLVSVTAPASMGGFTTAGTTSSVAAAAPGGGIQVHNHFHGPVMGEREFVRKIQQGLVGIGRDNGSALGRFA